MQYVLLGEKQAVNSIVLVSVAGKFHEIKVVKNFVYERGDFVDVSPRIVRRSALTSRTGELVVLAQYLIVYVLFVHRLEEIGFVKRNVFPNRFPL